MITDISMGSGHFLVAAVDELNANFLPISMNILSKGYELNSVTLNSAELSASPLMKLVWQPMLLRRQIARRCIYGVDLNPTAVEVGSFNLIHTFVPGLPLSFLDWHLRQGNSIVGVATRKRRGDF